MYIVHQSIEIKGDGLMSDKDSISGLHTAAERRD